MAQLVERVLGKDEVGGSNPPSSSKSRHLCKKIVHKAVFFAYFCIIIHSKQRFWQGLVNNLVNDF